MKYAKEFGYVGHMLPILINHMVIHHTLTYWGIILSMMICITIDNGSDNTVGGIDYSAHQSVGKFAEHHSDIVSCVQRKCQTRAGISGDVNKTLESVIITESKFSNRVLEQMTPKSTSIHG